MKKLILGLICIAAEQVSTAQTTTPQVAGIVLDRNWLSPFQGGSATMEDLGAILSPFAKPTANPAPVPNLKIYENVTYLMPYEDAKMQLGLTQKVVPKNKMGCAGFPKDSFFHYAFSGQFEGHFNKLYIVTDKADQVVAIQLVAESPKVDQIEAPYKATDWHAYNFINSRTKGSPRIWVDHKSYFEEDERWHEFRSPPKSTFDQPKGEVAVLRIDSLLMDPDMTNSGNRGSKWKPLEAVRLYLPKPMIELVLHCIKTNVR